LERDPETISLHSDLVEDLEVDSVDFLALVATLRERYRMKPDLAFVVKAIRKANLRTFADLAAFVARLVQAEREKERGGAL
jgi:acyl carrier protein